MQCVYSDVRGVHSIPNVDHVMDGFFDDTRYNLEENPWKSKRNETNVEQSRMWVALCVETSTLTSRVSIFSFEFLKMFFSFSA